MASTISQISEKVVGNLATLYPTVFAVNKSLYINAFQDALNSVVNTDIQLSRVEPDYERVMLQLVQKLSEDSSWKDLLTAGTGYTIIRMIASGIAYDQYSLMRAYQEAFLPTATSENAIMGITRTLGVRPQRKLPASVSVTFSRDSSGAIYQIPPYSTFSILGMKFFNRDTIVFSSTALSTTVTLYQGEVKTETIVSNGEPFQEYFIGNGDKSAANADLTVTVGTKAYAIKSEGPWTLARNGYQVYESTNSKGDIQLSFGNGDFGAIPQNKANITVQWVATLGTNGNIDSSGQNVTFDSQADNLYQITGVTNSVIAGGTDEISVSTYKIIASRARAANNIANRRSDYNTLALNFSGVKDALFRGQAELAPGRRSMMNVLGVTLLTDSAWNSTQFSSFTREFQNNYGMENMEFLRIDPTAIVVDINANIYCRQDASLADVQSKLLKNIEYLFEPRVNYLGFSIYISDIHDVLNGRNIQSPDEKLEEWVEYVVLNTPTVDQILTNKTYYCKLGTVTLNMYYTTRGGYQGRLDLNPIA